MEEKTMFPTCTNSSKFWLCKFIPQGNDDATSSKDEYKDEIGDLWTEATVETIVKPRNEGTHRQ